MSLGIVQALLIALLVAPFTVLAAGRADAAPPAETPFLTWNMQGASTQGRNLWTDYLPGILTDAPADVVMLQEVGAGVPNGAQVLPNPPGIGNDTRVTYAEWHSSQRPSEWYMVFLQTNDPNNPQAPGGRVNTIVMSRTPVDAAMVVDNPLGGAPGRPAVGIRLGDDWYFSYHALSGGGGDAVTMLDRIGEAVERDDRRRNWTVGADFNTRPDTLIGRQDYGLITTPDGLPPRVLASGRPTHRSPDGEQRELDYVVTTTPRGSFEPRVQPNQGGSDHNPVYVVPMAARQDNGGPQLATMPVGGYAVDGHNVAQDPFHYAGMRDPLDRCVVQSYSDGCRQFWPRTARSARAADASTSTFDYVGAVSRGNVADDDNQEEAFPGKSVEELRRHLAGDLRTYKPNVVLLQIDVANDLAKGDGPTAGQEADQLGALLDQVHIVLPNTTVLVGDPVPSRTAAVRDEMYTGTDSYVSRANAVIASRLRAGHRIRRVPLDFGGDAGHVDTGESADGVPDADGYKIMTNGYAAELTRSWKDGTIVGPGDVLVNPVDMVADGTGVDSSKPSDGNTSGSPQHVMVVGDSISNGFEGDHTWRYRLWQWARAQSWKTEFVGPLHGTATPDEPHAPEPPPPAEDKPPTGDAPGTWDGAYARDVSPAFLKSGADHYAMWGRRLEQDVPTITSVMEDLKAGGKLPDTLLVELGFNDIGWLGAGADLTGTMQKFIDNARKANPRVRLVLANVPQRTTLGSANPKLGERTRAYDDALAAKVKEWSTDASPAVLADLDKAMGCDPSATSCATTYDGLHPNDLGEYRIARAFATTLHDAFGIGTAPPGDPVDVAERFLDTPANVTFDGTRQGVTLTWDKVFGAHGYEVQWRDTTADPDGAWNWARPAANRWDMSRQYYGQIHEGHTYELRVRAASGDTVRSDWSDITHGTARPTTPGYPRNVKATAGPNGGVLTWDPPTGEHSDGITAYAVYMWDKAAPLGITRSFSVSGTSDITILPKMPPGDYVVMISAWNRSGEGPIALSNTVTFD
ncbi:GDSL-type esterase/lipase family protein [Streptomyces cinerochromogenes]|uniref:GDSL-type esterase/lipase family protein n=1 Tax=Streptomyces cinerochromogenes TaxID=66422 RepID=UPI0016703C1A|nr:GDSL-type esterase/lipase family protein [Streptomyces cinerochromogenes]GGS48744.1 hypothetical protein GCM10010206_07840 [Streptomyces cinerochromogenes]